MLQCCVPFGLVPKGFFVGEKMRKLFTFTFALPILLSNQLPISFNVPKLEQGKVQENVVITNEKLADTVFDKQNPFGLALVHKNIEIKPVQSYFDKTQELAKMAESRRNRREVISREIPRLSRVAPEPDLAGKRALVISVASKYNIPWQILEAVWQVETGKSWDTAKRSYAGATGPMQFMPGTWRKYGVDGNGDGKVDITSAYDSLHAAAKYLAASGAASGKIEQALLAYNHSNAYVRKVISIARQLGY